MTLKLTGSQTDYDLLHYLVILPFGVATPSAIASGVDVWSWVIAEKSDTEVALMCEILSAWSDTIKNRMGLFSKLLKYVWYMLHKFTTERSSTVTRTPSTTLSVTVPPIKNL